MDNEHINTYEIGHVPPINEGSEDWREFGYLHQYISIKIWSIRRPSNNIINWRAYALLGYGCFSLREEYATIQNILYQVMSAIPCDCYDSVDNK